MPKAATARGLPTDLTFETAMQQLDTIVRQLESGQGSLDDAIANYEQGARLRTFCEQRLKDAELRISQIAVGTDGTVTATNFADNSQK